jgi:hypothetical protein
MKEPIGVRRNNPLNIVYNPKLNWKGRHPLCGDASADPNPRFEWFVSPDYGYRAAARTLLYYSEHYGLNTITGIIHRWAPPSENDTRVYCTTVSRLTGFGQLDTLDLTDFDTMFKLLKAMTKVECGYYPWPDFVIRDGIMLAGIKPNFEFTKTDTAKATAITTAGGSAAVVSALEVVNQAVPVIDRATQLRAIGIALVVLLAVGLVVYFWRKNRANPKPRRSTRET